MCTMDSSTLLALPTAPPPSGPQIFALVVNFLFPALALLVVSVRVAGRVAANQFAVDDWLVCIAMLMSIAETVISFFFIKTNFIGFSPDQIPPHDPTQGLIWSYAVQILYNPILALVKSSVLIFLIRLFGQKHGVRRFLRWLNVANVSQMVGVFFAIVLQCLPISFNWDPTVADGRCVDRRVLYVLTAVFNIFTDFVILGLTLWVFSSLKIPSRTKIPLLIVFLLGFLVTITSIIRLFLLVQGLYGIPIFSDAGSNNVGFVTSAIETNLALITASAPALRPIFRSRERGGWFARSVIATARRTAIGDNNNSSNDALDAELGQKPFGWSKPNDRDGRDSAPVTSSKFGRGGGRGGRKAGFTTRHGLRSIKSKSKPKPIITRVRTADLASLRSSPRPSTEEKIMTFNGLVRVSDIQREIDGIVKEIAVAGAGSYTGAAVIGSNNNNNTNTTNTANKYTPRTSSNATRRPQTAVSTSTDTFTITNPRPKTPKTPKTPRTPAASPPRVPRPTPRPSMETITVGATFVTPLPPRPSTSGSLVGGGGGTRKGTAPERYYSESIYPEQGVVDAYAEVDADEKEEGGRVSNDGGDRLSRYTTGGDRRFGVVTPRGTTPVSRGWEGRGRPF